MGSALVYKGCGEPLEGVDPPRIHRVGCAPIYTGCGESLRGVDPSKIHRMQYTLVYKGCGESLHLTHQDYVTKTHEHMVSQADGVEKWALCH